MSARVFVIAAVVFMGSCSGCPSRYEDLDASPWPSCPDGSSMFLNRCIEGGVASPCDLIEASGGCPDGYHCDPEVGTCVEGAECRGECPDAGECDEEVFYCALGELCVDGRCTCGEEPCPEGQVCARVVNDEGLILSECVAPDYDGDGDGHAVGDLDGDGRPDDCDDLDAEVGPAAEEVCDGRDNDCDRSVDEGFDEDGDGYTSCGSVLVAPDCDDSDPNVNPGAIDLCRLADGGGFIDNDCSESANSCPFGATCCAGVDGCVDLTSTWGHCGQCGRQCAEGERCVVGTCRSSVGDFVEDPEEGEYEIPYDEGTSNHPAIAFNWARRNHWFSWWADDDLFWHQHFYWEAAYGIAWVQRVGDRGLLMFTGRHFVSSPISPLSEVAGAVNSFLNPFRNIGWYNSTLVDVLSGEDTIPCLAPTGDLGYGLVWSDGSRNSQIQFASLGYRGYRTGWGQQVTHGTGEHLYPRIAWSPYYYFLGASFGLVYQREDNDDVQVYFQQIDSYWDWWFPFDVAWRVSNDPEGAFTPDIAYSPFGYGVVWQGAAENDLYFALVGFHGGNIIPPQRVTWDNTVAPWRPSIAWNGADGEFGVAYQATNPEEENQDIWFVRIAPYGVALAEPTRITSHRELQRHPDMAFTGDGYGIVWYDRESGTNEIAYVVLDTYGTIVDGPTFLTHHTGGGEATNPDITFASAADNIGGQTYSLAGWMMNDLLGEASGEFGFVWRDQATEMHDPRVHFLRLVRED